MALDLTPVDEGTAPPQTSTTITPVAPKLDLTPVPEAPQLPDTSGIEGTAKNNIAQQENPNQMSPAQHLDTAMGFKATSVISGENNGAPLPAPMRKEINSSYAEGTSPDATSYLQIAIPAAVGATNQGSIAKPVAGLQPNGPGMTFLKAMGIDVPSMVASVPPFTAAVSLTGRTLAPLAKTPATAFAVGATSIVVGTLAAMAASGITKAGQDAFLKAHPEIADAVGISPEQLKLNAEAHPWAAKAGQMASQLVAFKPGISSLKKMATNALVQGGVEAGREKASGENLSWSDILSQALVGAITKENSFGKKLSSFGEHAANLIPTVKAGQDAMASIVGKIVGKSASEVTPDVVDQQIAKGTANIHPAAQDFKDVATATFGKPEAPIVESAPTEVGKEPISDIKGESILRTINDETGVRPEQVYQDAKNNPEVAKDIAAGEIPKAYDHLREKYGINEEPEETKAGEETKTSEPPETFVKPKFAEAEKIPTVANDKDSKQVANDLSDKLNIKNGQDMESDIESMKREQAAKKEVDVAADKELYLKKETPSKQLSPEHQALYDKWVKPLREKELALYNYIKKFKLKDEDIGVERSDTDGYVRRIVKGKGHFLDRWDVDTGGQKDVYGMTGGKTLSTTTGSLMSRKFWVAENNAGDRVFYHGDMPEGKSVGDKITPENGNSGEKWTIKDAKTEEIEKETGLKYYKSAISNTEDNIRRLERVKRNIDLLEEMKKTLKDSNVAKYGNKNIPEGWRGVDIPQLEGWKFDPRQAEVLEDFYKKNGFSASNEFNDLFIKGMFLNPVPHSLNTAVDYFVSRGWRNFTPWDLNGSKYLAQGLKDVLTWSPEYREALKSGAGLRFPSAWKADVYSKMQSQFVKEMQQSKAGLDLAKSWGFDSVSAFVDGVFAKSQKVLWGGSDAMLMARMREIREEKPGTSWEDAAEEAHKHMVDYRVPSRVGESVLGPKLSRSFSQTLQGNPVVLFTRYRYGLFKSMGNIIKDGVSGDPERMKEAAGSMFAMVFLTNLVEPWIEDKMSQMLGTPVTGTKHGVTSVLNFVEKIGTDIASGKMNIDEGKKLISSQMSPSPLTHAVLDLFDRGYVPRATRKESTAERVIDYVMHEPSMEVPGAAYNLATGKSTAGEEAAKMIGFHEKGKKAARPFKE